MAKIDVKFMKGTRVTAKKMGNTYKEKKRQSSPKKNTK